MSGSVLTRPVKTVVVIGAGPSGLTAARRLKEAGLEVTVFERRSRIGGLWFSDHVDGGNSRTTEPWRHSASATPSRSLVSSRNEMAPPSACYRSLMTNLITPVMTFESFAYPPGTVSLSFRVIDIHGSCWVPVIDVTKPSFVPSETVFQYLQDFARWCEVEKLVQCDTFVRRVAKSGSGTWKVQLDCLDSDPGDDNVVHLDPGDQEFDAVVVCNGHYDKPYIPSICGLSGWMHKWPDRIRHSRHYQSNDAFKSKAVLVVGSGVSAFDIGKDIALVASVVYQAVRKRERDGREAVEKTIEQFVWSTVPDNMHQVAEVIEFGDPAPASTITEAGVMLADGSRLVGVDDVVLCTGYLYSMPFLDSSSVLAGSSERERDIISPDGEHVRDLHMDMFYIPDPTLCFVGIPRNITTFQLFDLQAQAIAAVLAGKATLPSEPAMRTDFARRTGPGKELHSLGFAKETAYISCVAALVNTQTMVMFAHTYKDMIRYAQEHGVDICRERLRFTTVFRGKSEQEITVLVESVVERLEQALALLEKDENNRLAADMSAVESVSQH